MADQPPPVHCATITANPGIFDCPPIDNVADPPDHWHLHGVTHASAGRVQRDWSRKSAGGMPLEGPWSNVVAPNITPDKEHGGIGDWADGALTRGVAADGRHLLPPMGARAPIYSHITESDLRDLIAYLKSLPAQ